MGGANWDKHLNPASQMPDSALCAENRINKAILMKTLNLLRFQSSHASHLLDQTNLTQILVSDINQPNVRIISVPSHRMEIFAYRPQS